VISFRYHLVSIVAVFLALATGVLVGTTVLDQGIVATLEARTRQFERDADELRARVATLEEQLARSRGFSEEVLPLLVSGELAGTPVVVVTHEGVDGPLVARAVQALDLADADVVAELSMAPRMTPRDDASLDELATILGVELATPDALASQAAVAVADRLSSGPDGSAPEDDLLAQLLSGGFLVSRGGDLTESDLASIGGEGVVVVVLAGGEDQPAANPGPFLVPLVEQLVRLEMPTAAGESASTVYRFVPVIRSDTELDGADGIVTVDDLDEAPGAVSLVLGLDQLLVIGRGGHYGFKDGATGSLPSP
jgi:copper transport outer membrane protein MctB